MIAGQARLGARLGHSVAIELCMDWLLISNFCYCMRSYFYFDPRAPFGLINKRREL
jgi:hypothetical protein